MGVEDELQSWLHLLSHPVRRQILWLVWDTPMPATDIALHFDIAPNTVSTHLAKLTEAGFLTVDVKGTSRFYRAHPPSVGKVHSALDEAFGFQLGTVRPFGTGYRSAPIGGPELLTLRSNKRPGASPAHWTEGIIDATQRLVPGIELIGSLAPPHVLQASVDDLVVAVRCHWIAETSLCASWAWGSGQVPLPPGIASITITSASDGDFWWIEAEQRCFNPMVNTVTEPHLQDLLNRVVEKIPA